MCRVTMGGVTRCVMRQGVEWLDVSCDDVLDVSCDDVLSD